MLVPINSLNNLPTTALSSPTSLTISTPSHAFSTSLLSYLSHHFCSISPLVNLSPLPSRHLSSHLSLIFVLFTLFSLSSSHSPLFHSPSLSSFYPLSSPLFLSPCPLLSSLSLPILSLPHHLPISSLLFMLSISSLLFTLSISSLPSLSIPSLSLWLAFNTELCSQECSYSCNIITSMP